MQVELVPLVAWVKVVCVDDVVAGSSLRFKNLVGLIVVSLEELLKVEVVLAS